MFGFEKCLMCGKSLNKFSAKAQLVDGCICSDCFSKAGFTFNERSIENVKSVTFAEFDEHSRRILGDDYPDMNNPEYVLRKAKASIVQPNIVLKDKEICYFYAKGAIGKLKTKRTNYKQKSHSYTTITGKRVTYGTRTNQGAETYYEKTPCEFYMTSERFIATVPQGDGFSINVNKILGIHVHRDSIELNNNGKAIIVFLEPYQIEKFIEVSEIFKSMAAHGLSEKDLIETQEKAAIPTPDDILDDIIISTVLVGDDESKIEMSEQKKLSDKKATEESLKKTEDVDPVSELRRYKALLDDGIITQEEFEKKKQQLLSI